MLTDVQPGSNGSVSQLMNGIAADAGELLKQQVELLRVELKANLRKARKAEELKIIGAAFAMIGSAFLCVMLVHLLSWAAPELPLWACYGIVGGVVIAVGGVLVLVGIHQFKSFHPLPDQTIKALKENAQWIRQWIRNLN